MRANSRGGGIQEGAAGRQMIKIILGRHSKTPFGDAPKKNSQTIKETQDIPHALENPRAAQRHSQGSHNQPNRGWGMGPRRAVQGLPWNVQRRRGQKP